MIWALGILSLLALMAMTIAPCMLSSRIIREEEGENPHPFPANDHVSGSEKWA